MSLALPHGTSSVSPGDEMVGSELFYREFCISSVTVCPGAGLLSLSINQRVFTDSNAEAQQDWWAAAVWPSL